LLEAAAMGKPLIATDVAGCRQVVGHGENGFLCAPQNAQSLADAMLQFIALTPEPRAAMGVASREKAVRKFNEQQVFDAYLAVLATL
jgi:glycosyltransferase involved in cell wall biosynthesis